MSIPIEEPTITKRGGTGYDAGEMQINHPAFAQISVSRVSGNTALYDSDFRHNHYIVLRIAKSYILRHLNRDWHHAEISGFVEVAMTESQWATMVSSLNMGGGVPCTLQRYDGKMIPGLPTPESRHEQFAGEIREDLREAVTALDEASALVQSLGLSKAKAEAVMGKLSKARQTLDDSIPFVVKSSDKHMEKTTESAKQEIQGYMLGVIQRAGLEQLTGGVLPLQIEDSSDA